jgi:imidazolonepropionase-like amidohydrolase
MKTIIIADQLVDGTGRPPIDSPVVIIENGLITEVRTGHSEDVLRADGARLLDYCGCTLLPGMIDAHVHMNQPGDGTPFQESMAQGDSFLGASIAFAARRALEAGVTTVRDVGGRLDTGFEARDALQRGYGEGARMLLAGPPITITGGHMRWYGGEVDGVAGVRAQVRKLIGKGADWIKVAGSGGGTPNTISHLPSFRPEEVAAVVDEAHRFGVKVTMHCLCAEAMRYGVAAGVDGIEHGWFLVGEGQAQVFSPELADMIAEAGIVVTTTLSVGQEIIAAMDARPTLTSEETVYLDGWRRTRDETIDQFNKLREHGVKFIGGTDAGWRFTRFDSLTSTEAWLMTEGGMTAVEAIVACTGESADLLGIANAVGRIVPGLEADLFAVQGDPLGDLRKLSEIRMVMQKGLVKVAGKVESRQVQV